MAVTRMPDWLEPMAPTLTQDRFSGPDWLFERKFDGIRLLAYTRGAEVRLFSRNRLPRHLPALARTIGDLPVEDVILDGELDWGGGGYHVFDILWLNARLVTGLPLEERRALLGQLPLRAPLHRVDLLDDEQPWERAAREGWEGVIAKRRGSPYEHRRSKHWLKMKIEASQEFVVGGFTDPQGARVGLGALLVGYYDEPVRLKPDSTQDNPVRLKPDATQDNQVRPKPDSTVDLVFAGKVGTGFDTSLLRGLRQRLDAIEIAAPPFTKATGLPRRAHWVRPEIVVQVSFIEWTPHGKLRHPRLIGVRADKPAREVTRDS
jgi:ATP-dependent DNA ligase